MRVTLDRILVPLILGLWGWSIWSAFSSGRWRDAALFGAILGACLGVQYRKIWGKYLIYLLSVTGLLWVAYQIWLEIAMGRLFTREGGLSSDLGALLATIIALSALAAISFLCIGGSYYVHCEYKKMERDRHAEDVTGNSSSPPSQ